MAATPPLHVTLAQNLLESLPAAGTAGNQYNSDHGVQALVFPGDAGAVRMVADCSGLMFRLFDRAAPGLAQRMRPLREGRDVPLTQPRVRPFCDDFYASIEAGRGLTAVRRCVRHSN